MTTSSQPPKPDDRAERGYRGALPAQEDHLARPWMLTIIGILVLVVVLSIVGIPSSLIPDPTPVPLPSTPASGSIEPSASASGGASASASVSASASASASASPSP